MKIRGRTPRTNAPEAVRRVDRQPSSAVMGGRRRTHSSVNSHTTLARAQGANRQASVSTEESSRTVRPAGLQEGEGGVAAVGGGGLGVGGEAEERRGKVCVSV